MPTPTISLCMIVKDEAEHLPGCLRSVKDIVDEIIIVDTGSIDDTVSIAESFGAQVIHHPWQDDFAKTRNVGLQAAVGDWILWLDADEELDTQEGKKLKDLLTRDAVIQQRIEGIQFYCINYLDNRVEQMPVLRMVRNRPEYRFEGRLHEQIMPSVLERDPTSKLGEVEIHIHHYGYLPQNLLRKKKPQRNIDLLVRLRSEEPENTFHLFNLANEFLRINEHEKGVQYMDTFLLYQHNYPRTIISTAHKLRILGLHCLHRYEEVICRSEEAISLFKDYTDLYHFKANGLVELGYIYEAIHTLEEALRIGPPPQDYVSEDGKGSYRTCYELGHLYEHVGELDQAVLFYTEAVQINSNFSPALEGLNRIELIVRDREVDAEGSL
jgi:glycosyltransferase involved in cell wall biosynthesis